MKRINYDRVKAFDYESLSLFGADQDTGTSVPGHGNSQPRVSWYNEVHDKFGRSNHSPNFIHNDSNMNHAHVKEVGSLENEKFEMYGFDITEVAYIHTLRHLLTIEYPLIVLWGNHTERDISPKKYTQMETDQSPRGIGKGEKMEGNFVNRFEFSISPISGLSISGMSVTGRVLNYLWGVDEFIPTGNYVLGLCMGPIPSDKELSKSGLVLICSYNLGELLSPRNTRRLDWMTPGHFDLPPLALKASLLRMIEKVKDSVGTLLSNISTTFILGV